MKQAMTLQDVWNYYKTSKAIQTCEGFELPDESREFTLVIPHEFYRFFDGSLIDPTEMLVDRMGWMKRELLRNLNLCTPVILRYVFGRVTLMVGEKMKFYMMDPMKSTACSMDILVEAEWDLRQGASNEGWIPEVEKNWKGGTILLQKTIPADTYETKGKQIWILRATTAMTEIMKLRIDFYTWQRQAIMRSYETLQKFEVEKEDYQKRIMECLDELPGRVHLIVAADEEELWPKYDANRELWERYEYDWQIIQYDDYLEILWRGGSPGVVEMRTPRYDAIGLHTCQELLTQSKRLEDDGDFIVGEGGDENEEKNGFL